MNRQYEQMFSTIQFLLKNDPVIQMSAFALKKMTRLMRPSSLCLPVSVHPVNSVVVFIVPEALWPAHAVAII